jgi:DNA-binding LytR/AlgR family response regulator
MAAKAFDLGVADFVVAPVLPERVQRAMERALGGAVGSPLRPAPITPRARIRVKCRGSYIFLDPEELVWVEASRSYLNLHCLDRVFRIREPLNEFMRRIATANFLRIHRSTLVNANYIREVRSWGFGDYAVVLRNSKEFPVSRSYRNSVDLWVRNGDVASYAVDDSLNAALLSSASDDPEALLA